MFYKPDYNGGSIVNLMSTITGSFGISSKYSQLNSLSSEELDKFDNILNLVVDGMGYEYLFSKRPNILKNNTVSRLTSVFPTTTSACITSFATGLAPKEHGVTGWFVRLKEKGLDIPSTILPFVDRRNDQLLTDIGIMPEDVFSDNILSKKIDNLEVILPDSNKDSLYSNFMMSNARKYGYKGMSDFFKTMTEVANSKSLTKRYIYSYLPDLDAVFHKAGNIKDLSAVFNQILRGIDIFMKDISDSNTAVLITADHGLIEGKTGHQLNMNELPEISNMLDFPLCGEPRAAYCYVKDEYRGDFKKVVEDSIGHAVTVFTREEMIIDGYFGLLEQNPKFSSRIGDFILVCKENYVLKDFLENEEVQYHKADHGGLSCEEMFVPLVLLEA